MERKERFSDLKYFINHFLTKNNQLANTLITDTGLRTVLFTVPGITIGEKDKKYYYKDRKLDVWE